MKKVLRAFTLLELLTVIAIIAILGAIAMVGYQRYIASAKATEIVMQYDELRTRSVGRELRQAAGGTEQQRASQS